VKVLLWSRDGRLLLSAGLDGSIAVWDVLQGKPCLSKKLPWGISHVACAPPHAPGDLTVQPVLVSFVGAPARLLPSLQALPEPDASRKDTMAALEETGKLLPAIALAGEGRKAKLLSGKAAGAEGHLAVPTPCGKCIVSAGRGMLCLLRRKDFAILDALKLDGIPSVTRLEFDASGRQLLVGTTGRHVRVFSVTVPDDGTTSFTTEELIKALPLRSKKEESLVRGGGQEAALLRLTRRFTAQIERLDWGPCCFSPGEFGGHITPKGIVILTNIIRSV